MRAVVQRVLRASVRVAEEEIARIGAGLCVLVGVAADDTAEDAAALSQKVVGLRIFEDAEGKMNRDVRAVSGAVLAVSQFTLFGDVRRGLRPSFGDAMEPAGASALFDAFCSSAERHGVTVARGRFRAHMVVSLENDGPVTILVDTRKAF